MPSLLSGTREHDFRKSRTRRSGISGEDSRCPRGDTPLTIPRHSQEYNRPMPKGLPRLHLSLSRVMFLVLSVTVVSALALCLLAWRLSVSDRADAQQRYRERLDHAADSASAALLQGV